eukprot:gnl/TRDRNA2_/TRDRNA2_150275_c0_seq1.p1 gnl/TRDRNA2_/TRDRNA2_150275_c0~~gnl/TRDRNA2_/TRDRNA2_150275_c0_seq1.p1  ORF type:complete len:394 (+),score=46.71 gnl/TRDRNA2_/TRDRNA2_150275_c0_seq1:50-1231(+)
MCRDIVIVVFAFVTHAHAKELATSRAREAHDSMDKVADQLADRVQELDRGFTDRRYSELDGTILGKPSHLVIRPRPSRILSRSVSPVRQGAGHGHNSQEVTAMPVVIDHRSNGGVSHPVRHDTLHLASLQPYAAQSEAVVLAPSAPRPPQRRKLGWHKFPDEQKSLRADGLYDIAMIAAFRLVMGRVVGWQSSAKFFGGEPGESYSGLLQETFKLLEQTKGSSAEATEKILSVFRAFPTSPQLMGANEISYRILGFLTPFLMRFLVGDCTTQYGEQDGVRGSKVTIDRCRFLEESKCKSVCGLCKQATEVFFNKDLNIPMTLEPNFDDCSCTLVWGKAPKDDLSMQDVRCYDACSRMRIKSSKSSMPGCPLVAESASGGDPNIVKSAADLTSG